MKKHMIITAAVIAAISTGFLATGVTFAQDATDSHMSSLVQKIADKFHLNKADVQAVFDANREEQKAHMQKNYEARLDQLVTEGKITEAQKTLILSKQKELVSERDAQWGKLQDMTDEERKNAIDAKRTELEDWAKTNGINISYLMPFGKGGMHMHGGPWRKGVENRSMPSATPAQ